MRYIFPKNALCEKCGADLSGKIEKFLDDEGTVYSDVNYTEILGSDPTVICDCGKAYDIVTGTMTVEVFLSENETYDPED